MKRFKDQKWASLHSLHSLSLTINLEESYLVPRQRRLTWRSRTSYLANDEHGGRRSIAGIKESFEGYRPPSPMVLKEIPFKFSTCKTSAGVIKEIHYKMQHVQD